MGYVNEELEAGKRVLASVGLYSPRAGEAVWPRNGVISVVAHLPFLAASHLLLGESERAEDWLLSFEPILFTAGILTILFRWIWRINGSARWAFILSFGAGFCTMLWPYAYIGLEVQQSFFLMLTGYLVLARKWQPTFLRLLAVAICAGFAISVKTAGTVLIPAVAFLIWKFFEGERKTAPLTIVKIVLTIGITGLIYRGNSYLQMMFWDEWGGSSDYLRQWIVRDPVAFYLNVVSFLGSANKGLIVFAPLVIVSLFAVRSAWKRERDVTGFALLAFVPPLLGFSMLMIWSDENWGPRYLHEAIAPMVLCLGAARWNRPFGLRSEIPLVTSLVVGFMVSFLGAFFSYGALQYVASQTRQATLERFQSDLVWNHVRFNARLLNVWLTSGEATEARWTPVHHPWDFSGGAPRDPSISVNLRDVMEPQATLVRDWGTRPGETGFGRWLFSLLCLLGAPVASYRVLAGFTADVDRADDTG
ncbi:MAG TPA: hypothetical protein VMS12_05040 [Thermoanaerobaculia bacterium]|nr:hypothetical protein [Thermoanaerobaculia bacterium]